MTTATVGRRVRLIPSLRLPRITRRRAGALAALIVVLVAAWFWFRSSSVVAVKQIQVVGVAGPNADKIVSTLKSEAATMTTLNLSTAKLENAVSAFPHIAAITASTHFPHGVTITVDEQLPVASVASGGATVAVDAAGLLLPHQSTVGLPSLSVAPDTGGTRVTHPSTLGTLQVLGAAPYQLLAHIQSARTSSAHGITVQLRSGPNIYFGNTSHLAAKWEAADAVLANSSSAGASYIDVTAPDRPAAGTT